VHEENDEFAYMAKPAQEYFEKGTFLLDGAATSHLVDEFVALEDESKWMW
jgi:DNA-directed RNA polymerase subunit F